MDKKEGIITSVISIVLGVMLIIMKGGVINLAITFLGIAILISAIIDFVNRMINRGIIKAVISICILVFGWLFIELALFIFAASIIIMGLLQIANIHKFSPVNLTIKEKIMLYLKPVVTVLAGACLLFNQSGTINWIFVVAGILLIIESILELVTIFRNY